MLAFRRKRSLVVFYVLPGAPKDGGPLLVTNAKNMAASFWDDDLMADDWERVEAAP